MMEHPPVICGAATIRNPGHPPGVRKLPQGNVRHETKDDPAPRPMPFALISLVAGVPISATIGVGSLTLAGYADASRLVSMWMTWWLGDPAGALVITPVIVLWIERRRRPLDRHLLEAGAVFALAIVVGIVVFSPLIPLTAARDPLGFLTVVPLMWAALRCAAVCALPP